VSRALVLLLSVVLLLLGAGAASARGDAPVCAASCQAAPAGSGALFVVSGHGWGHGVGMSQYGAYGYALHGWTYDKIVAHYYPGTEFGQSDLSRVRVLLAPSARRAVISAQSQFMVRDGKGKKHKLRAGVQALGGLRFFLTRNIALFAEYKFIHAESF